MPLQAFLLLQHNILKQKRIFTNFLNNYEYKSSIKSKIFNHFQYYKSI